MKSEEKTTFWAHQRKWNIVFGVTSVIAVVWLLGTAAFIFDVKDTRFVRVWEDKFGVYHNCLTAYATAAYLASIGTENIYNPAHYTFALSSYTPIHESVRGLFRVDEFMYPPPFLSLPYGLLVIFKSFLPMRTAWFFLTVLFVITALVGVAWWCGAFRTQQRLLLFPLLLCAPTVHLTLQIGNAHIVILAISILAMIAFDEQYPLVGGALLGFATVAKMWPAVLVVFLLMQRRWKPVLYCAIAIAVYTLGGFLLFGPAPYQDFITYELPRLSSGEAFRHMSWYPQAVIENMSIFGLPHKLAALDLISSQEKPLSPVLGWSFTVMLGVIVIVTGLRCGKDAQRDDTDRLLRVQLWLTLLTLMQLRSPFLPWHYGVISTLWLLLLLAASMKKWWTLAAIGVAWIALSINIPIAFMSKMTNFHVGYTLFMSLVIYGTMVVSLRNYYVHTYGLGLRH